MSVPLDYSERIAAMQKTKGSATATYTHLMEQLETPVAKQVRTPEKTSRTWQRLFTEAQVKFHTGLAPSMHEALGQVAKEQPQLYELYRQEQLFQGSPNPVQKSVPPATAPVAMPPGILVGADGQPVTFEKQVARWKAHPEERRAYERHFGRRV